MADAVGSVFSASIALIAGYAFIRLSYYQRFNSAHLRTDRFALHVLGYSFLFFILGEIVAEFMPDWTPSEVKKVAAGLRSAGITPPVVNAIAIALVLALADNLRVRYLMRKDIERTRLAGFRASVRMAATARFIRKSTDAALRVIFRATVLNKTILVTLKSHKVYVGKPYMLPWEDPTQTPTFIKILPIKSGYRDPATKKVNLPTRYDELSVRLVELEERTESVAKDFSDPFSSDVLGLTNTSGGDIIANVDIEDLGVVIAWAEVESLMIFDENLYRAFQDQGPGQSPA